MIYIVDEDVRQMRPYSTELKIRGFEVEILRNADEGWMRLKTAKDIDLAIFDVMIGTGETKESKFNRKSTHNFSQTGLRLLEDLCKARMGIFPERAVIFSMASDRKLVSEINRVSKEKNIPYLKKRDYSNAFLFGEWVEKAVAGRKR
ncbi:MAG: response regulator [Gammaproteobacteria bacterium]|nr:response regulator [Gammaproteobacteria bacterium]